MGRPKKQLPQASAEPEEVSCHGCSRPLRADCFCEQCKCYFGRVRLLREPDKWEWLYGGEPQRACSTCAYRLKLDGYCWTCDEFQAPKLTYKAYQDGLRVWEEDPLGTDRRCTREENLHHLRELRKMLAVRGGPMSRAMLAAVENVPF